MLKIEHLKERPRKDGTIAYYWIPTPTLAARGWKSERIPADYKRITDPTRLRAAAIIAAETLNGMVAEWRKGAPVRGGAAPYEPPHTKLKSVAAGIALYKKYDDGTPRSFCRLAAFTRAGYTRDMNRLEDLAASESFEEIDRDDLLEWQKVLRAKELDGAANNLGRMVRILANFLRTRGWKMKDFSRIYIKPSAPSGMPWPMPVIDFYEATADKLGLHAAGSMVRLDATIGQRMGDIFTLPRARYRDGVLSLLASHKTGVPVPPLNLRKRAPKVTARLDAELERQKARGFIGRYLFLTDTEGKPFSYANWRRIHRRIVEAMIAEKLTAAGWYKTREGVPLLPETTKAEKKAGAFRWWNDTTAADLKRGRANAPVAELMERAVKRAASFETDYVLANDDDKRDAFLIFIGDLQFRYLRHTAVCRLAEAGCSSRQIAGISGHIGKHVDDIISRYAIQSRATADATLEKLERYESTKAKAAAND